MSDLRGLYTEAILDHSRSPRHAAPIDDPTHTHAATNPLCGDRVRLQVRVEGDRIDAISARTRGCALCVAAASMMAEWMVGQSVGDIEQWRTRVDAALDPTREVVDPPVDSLTAIRHAPSRVQCVRLPWDALAKSVSDPPQGA